jgi:hypothetical protein
MSTYRRLHSARHENDLRPPSTPQAVLNKECEEMALERLNDVITEAGWVRVNGRLVYDPAD